MWEKFLVAIGKESLGLLLQLLGLAQDQATQEQQNLQTTIITNTQLSLQNLTYGLAAAYDQRVDIISRLTIMQASIDAIPVTPQLDDQPVILPTTPPTGYGAPTSSDIGDAVWSYMIIGSDRTASDTLSFAGNFPINWDHVNGAVIDSTDARWLVGTTMQGLNNIHDIGHYDVNVDYDTIISSDDTILDWLIRVYWDYGVTWAQFDSMCGFHDLTTGAFYYLNLTEQQFRLMRDASPSSLVLPPLWPGLAAVNLGTPVSLDTGVTIAELMDGVIVTITDQPSRLVFFTFDDANSYRNLGALSFFSDNGDQEPFQPLGFTSAIYCAKTMKRAAGVKLRTSGGVSGTVTPWTIVAG